VCIDHQCCVGNGFAVLKCAEHVYSDWWLNPGSFVSAKLGTSSTGLEVVRALRAKKSSETVEFRIDEEWRAEDVEINRRALRFRRTNSECG